MTWDERWAAVWPHRDRLIGIARRRVRDDAEDVVQEAMLRVVTAPDVDLARVGALLTTVTVNLCVDVLRRRATRSAVLPRLVDPGADPLAVVDDAAEAAWLAGQVLSVAERAALCARVDGASPGSRAGEAALHRARVKLRAVWRATLAGLGVARVRRATVTAAGVGAVTVAAVFTTAPRNVPDRVVAAPRVAVAAAATRTTPPLLVVHVAAPPTTATVVAARVAQPRRAPERHAETVTIPPVDAGPAGSGGLGVTIDDTETPTARVSRCVARGVSVDVDRVHVTCR